MSIRKVKDKKHGRCPVCGGSHVEHLHPQKNIPSVCRVCGCKAPVGVVRERDHEVAIVDWGCRRCGHKWSDGRSLPLDFVVGLAFWSVYGGCERCLGSSKK